MNFRFLESPVRLLKNTKKLGPALRVRGLEGAHRALWASPSHRGNLLLDQFTKVGIGVVRGPDGAVWVTELFTG